MLVTPSSMITVNIFVLKLYHIPGAKASTNRDYQNGVVFPTPRFLCPQKHILAIDVAVFSAER